MPLKGYSGVLQTDGYAGYRGLADPKRPGGPVTLALCWSHWRRQFFDLAKSPPAPIATEALKRIAELYQIETEIRGNSAAERRAVRQEKRTLLVAALKTWVETTLARLAGGAKQALRRQSIGANIRNARKAAGLSQRRIAERILDGYLSDVGLGRPAVTRDFLVRVAYLLGVPVEGLWRTEASSRTKD